MDLTGMFDKFGLAGGILIFFLLMFRFVMMSYKGLVSRIMAENEKREERYISVIGKLSDSFEDLSKEFQAFRHEFERRRQA